MMNDPMPSRVIQSAVSEHCIAKFKDTVKNHALSAIEAELDSYIETLTKDIKVSLESYLSPQHIAQQVFVEVTGNFNLNDKEFNVEKKLRT